MSRRESATISYLKARAVKEGYNQGQVRLVGTITGGPIPMRGRLAYTVMDTDDARQFVTELNAAIEQTEAFKVDQQARLDAWRRGEADR